MGQPATILMTGAVLTAGLALLAPAGCRDDAAPGASRSASEAGAAAAPAAAPASDEPARTRAAAPAGPAYEPRLVTAGEAGHEHTNRLIDATSPYLLQHAHNPVHWYPWGPEAFEAARQQDKPIFLSIGYSTCYWCHVMERESFENEQTAAIMNEHFVSIKVDREERPDVDDVYMAAVRVLNRGRGGWPMSIFLEPDSLKPFYGGTYFPPRDRYGRPGFPSLLRQLARQWATGRQTLLERADRTAASVQRQLTSLSLAQPLDESSVDNVVTRLMGLYDSANGGFGRAPKFPLPGRFQLLMGVAWDDPTVQSAVTHTLDRMAMGGMYDQVGGGFHRYSTDRRWLVPHFEKMLYDNGQLASVYAEAYERTGDPFYARVLRETLDYVVREMTGERGRLFSAQDAEVNAREGGSYVWTAAQVRAALTEAGLADQVDFAMTVYGLDGGPNFRDPHHPGDTPSNVLYLPEPPVDLAGSLGVSMEEFRGGLDRIDQALLEVRYRRDQPITDDKTLAGWSGLMIAGLADGGRVLDEPRYVKAAGRAARFVLDSMRAEDGGLLRSYRDGRATIDAFLEDYAFFIGGLLALHRATGDPDHVNVAAELADEARRRFWDESFGGYFDTLAGQQDLFVRGKSSYDGATPSGNSVMLHNLLDLHEQTGRREYLDDASATLGMLSSRLKRGGSRIVLSALALHRVLQSYPDYVPGRASGIITPENPVQIALSTTRVALAPDAPQDLTVTLTIDDAYHINANEPGLPELIGLRVQAIGTGFEADVAYPRGDPYRGSLFDREIRIHSGSVTIPVRLQQTEQIRGRPRLLITYQVCTDTVCLAPTREVLPLEIAGSTDG